MQKIRCKLTVFFEDPFWVGVYEREQDGRLQVGKITFGAQPSDRQVHQYLLGNWHRLTSGPAVDAGEQAAPCKNPKRRQRQIARQTGGNGVGTKSQQALRLQREQGKLARKRRSRQQREEEKQRKFELRRQRKKDKHKGH